MLNRIRKRLSGVAFLRKSKMNASQVKTCESILCDLGVTVVGKATFDKLPKISLCKGSQIIIEDGVNFVSDPNINPSGVVHPCTLVTQRPDAIIHVGKDSGMSGATICCMKKVIIGEFVGLGANVKIFDNDFHSTNPYMRKYDNEANIPCKEVVVDDYAWIGADSIILKGVHIGYGAVVGAGSVVTSDVPPLTIYAGNPAVFIKRVEMTDEQFSILFGSKTKPDN